MHSRKACAAISCATLAATLAVLLRALSPALLLVTSAASMTTLLEVTQVAFLRPEHGVPHTQYLLCGLAATPSHESVPHGLHLFCVDIICKWIHTRTIHILQLWMPDTHFMWFPTRNSLYLCSRPPTFRLEFMRLQLLFGRHLTMKSNANYT